jgi:hypothetical protein
LNDQELDLYQSMFQDFSTYVLPTHFSTEYHALRNNQPKPTYAHVITCETLSSSGGSGGGARKSKGLDSVHKKSVMLFREKENTAQELSSVSLFNLIVN